MKYGYTGKILNINLTDRTFQIEELADVLYRKLLGGEGLGAWLLNERVPIGADPLGKDNMLVIAPGLLTNSFTPGSPRVMVMTKSPLTGGFGDSNAGGFFGPEIRSCGFDAICITGQASSLVYVSIINDDIKIEDATHLEGLSTVDTKKVLIEELNEPRLRVAAIGLAGEKQSLISSVMFDDRAAARSGVGAVMGSKNLKSIVVKGDKKQPIFDNDKLRKYNTVFRKHVMGVDYFVLDIMRNHGSCGFMSLGVQVGIAPIKNWQLAGEKHFPQHANFDSENVSKYKIKKHGCKGCPVACGGTIKVKDGPYKLNEARLPEYETLTAFGPFILVEDVEMSFKAQELCDNAGIDTISVGHAVAYAIECQENGILTNEDTYGLDLKWGNGEDLIQLVEDICNRERLGKYLADGVKKAIEYYGDSTEPYGVHFGGQEPAFHDPRYEGASRGALYISDPTPGRHERCSGGQLLQLNMSLGPNPEFQPYKVSLEDDAGMGLLYAKGSKYYSAFSACGFCAYVLGAVSKLDVVSIINAFTGWGDFTAQDFMDAGELIISLRQQFSIREGLTPDKVKFPSRLLEKPLFESPMRGTDREFDFYKIREGFFEGLGWDYKTGQPSEERIQELMKE